MNAYDWFSKAQTEGWAIGAFNVDNLEILNAICLAGQKKQSPVMLEFSQGEVGYFGIENIVDIIGNAREHFKIPILLNLDHAKRVDDCMKAVDAGFDDVHFDGSDLDFAKNVEETKKVVEAAHAKGLLVEGEVDKLFGSSEVHEEEMNLESVKKSYSDPKRALEFVQETGVDIFAAFFGNVHGTFPNQPDLDIELLKKIKEALPKTFLSLHGGSGIPADQVREAIKVGEVVKVNINTELRTAFKDALAQELGESPQESAYYKITPDIVEAIMAVVEGKLEVLGSSGKV